MQVRIMTMLLLALIFAARQPVLAEGDEGACPVATALKELPQLEYQVGTKTTTCPKTAAALATAGTPVTYVVGKQQYKDRDSAVVALAAKTEALVKRFATAQKCEVSGTVSVGGQKLACAKTAAATAKRIQKAIGAVAVSYKVGDKVCNCPVESKKLAALTKADIVFVVDGKETTCPVNARLNVARAKYRAAVAAVAKAD